VKNVTPTLNKIETGLNIAFGHSFTSFDQNKIKINKKTLEKSLSCAILFSGLLLASVCQAQKTVKYNLAALLAGNKLLVNRPVRADALTDGRYKGVSCQGIVWLKGLTFSTGTIDIDLRGKDVFQQSFLGIAFYGVDTTAYDAVYFRPFNFLADDSLRRKHMVQYVSEPEFPWYRLRKEYPLTYESSVTPAINGKDWFHAHIVVTESTVTVYVDHSAVPSLTVQKLSSRKEGKFGLWTYALSGDFANLEIKTNK